VISGFSVFARLASPLLFIGLVLACSAPYALALTTLRVVMTAALCGIGHRPGPGP